MGCRRLAPCCPPSVPALLRQMIVKTVPPPPPLLLSMLLLLLLLLDKVRIELHGILELCKEPNTNEFGARITDAISKMEGKDGLWSSVSGDEKHYMSVMEACETLAECMNVHIAVFILAVNESALEESATIPGHAQ